MSQRDGYNYLVTEPNLSLHEEGLHRSSAAWGAIFNVPAFRQLIERSFGVSKTPALAFWDHTVSPKVLRDPFRDEITFSSVEEYRREYYSHIQAAKKALIEAEVFVLTLGLNEVWELRTNSAVLSRNPRGLDPTLIKKRTLTFNENLNEYCHFRN